MCPEWVFYIKFLPFESNIQNEHIQINQVQNCFCYLQPNNKPGGRASDTLSWWRTLRGWLFIILYCLYLCGWNRLVSAVCQLRKGSGVFFPLMSLVGCKVHQINSEVILSAESIKIDGYWRCIWLCYCYLYLPPVSTLVPHIQSLKI